MRRFVFVFVLAPVCALVLQACTSSSDGADTKDSEVKSNKPAGSASAPPASSARSAPAPTTTPDATEAAKPSTEAPNGTSADALCTSFCEWENRCGDLGVDPAKCLPACKAGAQAKVATWREPYTAGVTKCFASLKCDFFESEEKFCMDRYELGDPSYPNIPVVVSCLAKADACQDTKDTEIWVDERLCDALAANVDPVRKQAEVCVEKPCEEMQVCLEALNPYALP